MFSRTMEACAIFVYISSIFISQWTLLEYRVCWARDVEADMKPTDELKFKETQLVSKPFKDWL
jgi:hypothetical protein